MIEVDINLLPEGDRTEKTLLGRIVIVNDQTGTLKAGNYIVTLSDDEHSTRDGEPKLWKRILIKGFRRQEKGPYHMLLEILKKALSNKPKT